MLPLAPSRRTSHFRRAASQPDGGFIAMTNTEWCLSVLKQFWPRNVIDDQTKVTPAVSQIAGQIWNEWLKMGLFTGSVNVLALKNPSTPPGLTWVAEVIVSTAWHTFADSGPS